MYPRFLLETRLNDSARLVYLLLLDRARASMMNPGWEDGLCFIPLKIWPLTPIGPRRS